jgi:NAD(P)-dependent dehydrogenase (short-subunit alcohol dehydrogenase family)
MRDNLFDIQDQVIVVTGATGTLAGPTAKYLLHQGARVVFLGRSAEKLARLESDTADAADRRIVAQADVLDQPALEKVFAQVMGQFGRIDVLINGAGGNMPGATVPPDKSLFDISLDAYRQVMDVNFHGTLLPTLVFGRAIAEQKQGCIVNFSSMAADRAITRVAGYSNAKAAVENFTRWVAVELAQKYGDHVRANAIAPGFFLSDQNRSLLLESDGSHTPRAKDILRSTPFGRFGEAHEVFGAIHYLVSPAASFVTGTVLYVDGGFSCFGGV